MNPLSRVSEPEPKLAKGRSLSQNKLKDGDRAKIGERLELVHSYEWIPGLVSLFKCIKLFIYWSRV